MLDDQNYEGDRWRYGFRSRPPMYGTRPEGFIPGSEKDHPDYNHGTLDYPENLKDDVYKYELCLESITFATYTSFRSVFSPMNTSLYQVGEGRFLAIVVSCDSELELDSEVNCWLLEGQRPWIAKPLMPVPWSIVT